MYMVFDKLSRIIYDHGIIAWLILVFLLIIVGAIAAIVILVGIGVAFLLLGVVIAITYELLYD